MKMLVQEYGRIIVGCVVAFFCLVFIGTVMLIDDESGIKGVLEARFSDASNASKISAGTNTSFNTYKAPEFNYITKSVSLRKRDKSYTLKMSDGSTQTVDCSEFLVLAKTWNEVYLPNYTLSKAQTSTDTPFYFVSTNVSISSKNSGTKLNITEKAKVYAELGDVYLIKFQKSDGKIDKDSNNQPIVESVEEKTDYKIDGETIQSLETQYDAIAFKSSGSHTIYYRITDDYDFRASAHVDVMIEDVFTETLDSATQDVWSKF